MFGSLLARELKSRFVGSSAGWLWLIVNPLLLLAVYAFVFGTIFRARVPEGLDVAFVVWLAVALWPWLAFSEAVLQASESMPRHAALISKVPLRRELLVFSGATAAFLLQLAGYVAVLVVVLSIGAPLHFAGLPAAMLTLAVLWLLGCALGLFAAATRVFFRDLQQLLPTLMMFWFFLTPILYAPSLLPEPLRPWMALNPLAGLFGDLRAALLGGQALPGATTLVLAPVALALVAVALAFFRRLSPWFEDFL